MKLRIAKLLAAASLAGVLVAGAAQAQTQEAVAQTRFNKGRELFMSGQYAPALAEFRAATELYESPNTRLYIARCERQLGHVAAAYIELERAATEAADRSAADPRYASTRDAANEEAKALEPKLARVKVLAPDGLPPGARITVNGADVGTAAVGIAAPIDPGPIEVIAKAPGYLADRKTARAAAGESVEIKLRLAKAPASDTPVAGAATTPVVVDNGAGNGNGNGEVPIDTTPKAGHGLRNAGFVIGGIGIAGMGVFAAFAAIAQTRFDQLKNECGGACDASYAPRIDEGQTFQTIANVAVVAGGAALLTGAIMIVAGVSSEHKTAVTASIVPLVGGGFIAGVGRAF